MAKVIYISFPFRNKSIKKVHENIRLATIHGQMVQSLGFSPLIPHVNIAAVFTPKLANTYGPLDKEIVKFNFALLKKCDMMYVPDGFELTKGMKEEIKFCKKHKIKIVNQKTICRS